MRPLNREPARRTSSLQTPCSAPITLCWSHNHFARNQYENMQLSDTITNFYLKMIKLNWIQPNPPSQPMKTSPLVVIFLQNTPF